MPLISLKDVKMKYLKCLPLTLDIEKNDLIIFYGDNGAGKSTFIKLILKFMKPQQGLIKHEKIKVSYIPEVCFLPSTLSVLEYIDVLQVTFKQHLEKQYLEIFDVPLTETIKKLSKGNRQKVSIITSTISNPDFLIFDEPLSGFDSKNSKLYKKFIKILLKNNKTVLISTHKPSLFKDIATKMVEIC